VALGELYLPTDPAPGFGGILLAGIMATFHQGLDDESVEDLARLLEDLEQGRRIPQPRLRHRFQSDVVGLDRSCHKLMGAGEDMAFELQDKDHPYPQVLGAAYAAARLTHRARPQVFRLLRRATRWEGGTGPRLVAYLTGDEAAFRAWRRPNQGEGWALEVLRFGVGEEPTRLDVLGRYRDLVRAAHPDAGGDPEAAGIRIAELSEARRILLAPA
jgi:hypothetical protein